jgi:hypothetical protein
MKQRAAVIVGAGPAGLTPPLELQRRTRIKPTPISRNGMHKFNNTGLLDADRDDRRREHRQRSPLEGKHLGHQYRNGISRRKEREIDRVFYSVFQKSVL